METLNSGNLQLTDFFFGFLKFHYWEVLLYKYFIN